MPIPDFNKDGVLPPEEVDPETLVGRPHEATSLELCQRFGTNPERCTVLEGFLELRASLRQLGIDSGFQWVDGVFLEDRERLKSKPPDHIQVVTFLGTKGRTSEPAFSEVLNSVFNREVARRRFHADHMTVPLYFAAEDIVNYTRFWCGILSHQTETRVWKGFLQLSLNTPKDDAKAMLYLKETRRP